MEPHYDVVIIGGAFSGAAAGLLLKRERPETRVLILERNVEFDFKVGEATSEVAGCFLTRRLHLHDYLVRNHIPKQGLRAWFTTPGNTDFDACGELGPFTQTRLAAFQLDRSQLDAHILEEAVAAGCELWRPATVKETMLNGAAGNELTVKRGEETLTVRAKWVLDCSGKAAYLARKRGTLRRLESHPTNSMWARFTGTRDWDGHDLRTRYPDYGGKGLPHVARATATNHLTGFGWWCWIIPLQNGAVSVGLTYDPRLFSPPAGQNIPERLLAHLLANPVGKEIFGEATVVEGDARAYSHLPYYSEEVMGEGWACAGDAAGFMDPLYSQGLDYCAHTVSGTLRVIKMALDGQDIEVEIPRYNAEFQTSYHRWYRALYEGKYSYLGDAELFRVAYLMDLASYFIGPVRLVYDNPELEFPRLPYYGTPGRFFSWFMSTYSRRLNKLAHKRMAAGCYGRRNLRERHLLKGGFSADWRSMKLMRKGFWLWMKCEWHGLFLKTPAKQQVSASTMTDEQVTALQA